MKGQKAKIPRAINTGAYLDCVDNTGARTLHVISVKNYRGVKIDSPAQGLGTWSYYQ